MNDRVLFLVCFFLVQVVFLDCQATEIYKWKDSNGKIHFSDRDPNQSAKQVILRPDLNEERLEQARQKSKEFVERQQRRAAFRKEESEKEKKQSAGKEQKLAEQNRYCVRAKRELGILKMGVAVYRTGKTGERAYIDDAQRASEIKEWDRNIGKYCK